MPLPFAIPECRIGSCVEQRSNHLTIDIHPSGEVDRCPAYGQASRSVHSRYHRHPADLPISISQTTLSVEVRRFCCRNACCSRRTFAEQISDLLGSRARRTRRLRQALQTIVDDRRRAVKHVLRARIVLLSDQRLPVLEVASRLA